MIRFIFILISILYFNSINTFSQNVAIELQKMNVLYKSVQNPINIAIDDCPCRGDIILKAKYGKLILQNNVDSCHYYYISYECISNKETIFAGIKLNNKIKWIDSLNYELKDIPPIDYRPRIGGKTGGTINKYYLINQLGLYAPLENYDINLNFEVLSFKIEIIRNDSIVLYKSEIKGHKFTEKILFEIKNSQSNDRVRFYDIEINVYNNCPRKHEMSLDFIIE